jgi:acyl-coenzyme A thioesterase PaaI-like protein
VDRGLDMTAKDAADRIPPHHDATCWGCGDNPIGLGLPVPEVEGARRYEAWISFDERHQAGPGLVHGGLVAAALDEACGLLATWFRFPTVTARIFVRYRRPVAINTEYRLQATVDDERGRRIHVSGTLDDGHEPLAEARAAFVHVPLEHFLATPEGREAGARWQRRLAE